LTDLTLGAIEAARARLGAAGGPLVVMEVTRSTNDDARRAAELGAPAGAAFIADAQTAGRGRGGHAWHSPAGENLYLSMIARPRVPASSVAPVTLAIGVAVAEVIEARLAAGPAPAAEVRIKWPNDVLAAGLKIAGVLVEGQLRGAEVVSLVVGVGVNVRSRAFPEEIAARATSLGLLGCLDLDRATLAAELLAALGDAISRFERERLQGFAAALARRDALRGRRVAVGGISGTAAGIDAEGRLVIRGDGGEITAVFSGDVLPLPGPSE
jgi:BirA family transcriptional regulator, biotin operon repressor / biotin---[acetyl-CoA-carboxylase] ligase